MRTRCLLFAAGVLALAAPASAQPDTGSNEEVIVRAPPEQGPRRSPITAPILNVSLSREVQVDDLDLNTAWGQNTLRYRVRRTALALCQVLQNRFPIVDERSPPCFRTAFNDAMDQADGAIRDARLTAAR
jgi:UrcA family protein